MKRTIVILLVISFSSCIRLVDKIDLSSFQSTDKVQFEGYYFHVSRIPKYTKDSISGDLLEKKLYCNIMPLVFYINGLVYHKQRGITEDLLYEEQNQYQTLPHDILIKYWEDNMNPPCKSKKELIGWGSYHLVGDSIFIEYYDRKFEHPGLSSNKLVLENIKGVILSDSTIQIERNESLTEIYCFTKSARIPNSEYCHDRI